MVRVCAGPILPPFRMPWRKGIAVGRAFELLRADAQSHLAFIQKEIGFRYCRFHGLFHDDVGVAVRDTEGVLAFQWGHVDRIFDFLLSIGLKPFVELGPMPQALASGTKTFFHWRMNVTPPAQWAEWERLVGTFARHCVERYGVEEVREWYFEVWNEPNLDAFWSGTQDEYWQLYAGAARALRSVDSALRVGGPASAEAGWIDEFLDFCATSGTPVDFVSTHAYPQNEFARFGTREESPHKPGMYLIDTVREVRAKADRHSELGRLELHFTEWSSLDSKDKEGVDWYANETIDQLYGAALICHVCTQLDGDVDSLFWWVASDIFEEMGMPQSPFSNNFGMVTIDGIPKASFHAFRLLRRMRGERLPVEMKDTGPSRGASAARDGSVLRMLVWNHVPLGLPAERWQSSLQFPIHAEGALATTIQIREGAGSAYEKWIEMGRPQNITPVQAEALRALSQPEYRVHRLRGEGSIAFDLGPGEVLFVEISGPADPLILKGNDASVTDFWNQALSDIPEP